MAVYVNVGFAPPDGGKEWKHLDARCPLLRERAEEGFPITRVRNVDDRRPTEQHLRRRCPACFVERPPLPPRPTPGWVLAASDPAYHPREGIAWVYDIMCEPGRLSLVGMSSNLAQRLQAHWRSVLAGGFPSLWWYHDMLRDDPNAELTWTAEPFPRRRVRRAERERRRQKRAAGWQVTSDA
jgi:hypothetical protein